MSGPKEDIECVIRCVVRDGQQLETVVRALTETFGQGEEIDIFHERLVFVPHNEVGNLNVINRESVICIEYLAEKESCSVKYMGAPVNLKETSGLHVEATSVSQVVATTNIRRTLLKTGFTVTSDYAEKGLRFRTRRDAQTISITRPYNASLIEDRVYRERIASWDSLPGAFPFGRDYLLELSQLTGSTHTPEEALSELQAMLDRLVT
jgi:hypothetical protein